LATTAAKRQHDVSDEMMAVWATMES
jgi:hypothetical protein